MIKPIKVSYFDQTESENVIKLSGHLNVYENSLNVNL